MRHEEERRRRRGFHEDVRSERERETSCSRRRRRVTTHSQVRGADLASILTLDIPCSITSLAAAFKKKFQPFVRFCKRRREDQVEERGSRSRTMIHRNKKFKSE